MYWLVEIRCYLDMDGADMTQLLYFFPHCIAIPMRLDMKMFTSNYWIGFTNNSFSYSYEHIFQNFSLDFTLRMRNWRAARCGVMRLQFTGWDKHTHSLCRHNNDDL